MVSACSRYFCCFFVFFFFFVYCLIFVDFFSFFLLEGIYVRVFFLSVGDVFRFFCFFCFSSQVFALIFLCLFVIGLVCRVTCCLFFGYCYVILGEVCFFCKFISVNGSGPFSLLFFKALFLCFIILSCASFFVLLWFSNAISCVYFFFWTRMLIFFFFLCFG